MNNLTAVTLAFILAAVVAAYFFGLGGFHPIEVVGTP